MRRIALSLALLPSLAFADLQSEFDDAIRLGIPLVLKGQYRLEKPVVLKPKDEFSNVSVTVIGNGSWHQIEAMFDGPAIIGYELKDCVFTNIGTRNPIGSGWQLNAKASSGRMTFTNCRTQCKTTCFEFLAPNGADISCVTFTGTDMQGADTGLKVVGPNALNFVCTNVTASFCKTAFDLTQGGCGSTFIGGGASHCGTAFDVNAGYELSGVGVVVEDTGIALNIGSGTGSGIDFNFSDCRTTPVLMKSGTNGGSIHLSALKAKGAAIKLTGDSPLNYLKLDGAASLCPIAGSHGKVEKGGVFSATIK